MEDEELLVQIEQARTSLKKILRQRAILAGVGFLIEWEFEFPEPDVAEAYQVLFGHRVGAPTVWRLSFGKSLKWVGVSHPFGVKPGDIEVLGE